MRLQLCPFMLGSVMITTVIRSGPGAQACRWLRIAGMRKSPGTCARGYGVLDSSIRASPWL